MGEHLAAASCLALVLNFFLLWAASCDAARTEEDGMSLLQWEKAPPPPPSMREEELSAVRFKRDAKRVFKRITYKYRGHHKGDKSWEDKGWKDKGWKDKGWKDGKEKKSKGKGKQPSSPNLKKRVVKAHHKDRKS